MDRWRKEGKSEEAGIDTRSDRKGAETSNIDPNIYKKGCQNRAKIDLKGSQNEAKIDNKSEQRLQDDLGHPWGAISPVLTCRMGAFWNPIKPNS